MLCCVMSLSCDSEQCGRFHNVRDSEQYGMHNVCDSEQCRWHNVCDSEQYDRRNVLF